ncbi:Cerato-platanin-domain-containing protein [Rhizopogon vinicolor AM-OR11-026]|uniref:Cerato-platanin-domain-containing protein n=1 Tax=Rhizopogon vinicolor AM-OR11-026 TaxID=1314800 RepID=A0A1B7MNF4_9AGAM|nr:Cerato-platanin-domain-containing protein [Rhizopogon vinicolor AM-OR11-026]
MKFTHIVALLSAFAAALAESIPVKVTYDSTYSNPDGSLNNVACSNGYTTFSSLPSFPFIGGIPGATWNSPLCGTCWQLNYTTPAGSNTSVYITVVDLSANFNISPETFNALTNNNLTTFNSGSFTASAAQVDAANCTSETRALIHLLPKA